jgi:AcrR family transcriptional regulator
MGPENSAIRAQLMDGVEAVMREEGYGALTARSIAAKAGLKHQLVYYYFETMDDLLTAAYRRHTGRYWERIQRAFESDRPLHAFWRIHADPVDSALNMEYMALANHNEAIRAHTIEFGERVRRLGLEQVNAIVEAPPGGDDALSPFAVTMAISSIGSILGLEVALGLSGGHAETRRMIEWCLDQLEPATAAA